LDPSRSTHSYFGLVEADRIACTGDIIADVSSAVRETEDAMITGEKKEKIFGEQRTIKLIYRIAGRITSAVSPPMTFMEDDPL